jgi:hypothetical protein
MVADLVCRLRDYSALARLAIRVALRALKWPAAICP